MSTLITMVGQQPAAIAATSATLNKNAALKQVILLPTRKTETEYKRVERYLLNSLQLPPTSIRNSLVTTDIEHPKDEHSPAWVVLGKFLDRYDELDKPVYFDTSPGLNYQLALISYHFRNDSRFEALYADNRKLHNLSNGHAWDLEHVGFKELLDLYGLEETGGKKPEKEGEIVEDVTIRRGEVQIPLVYACERHGRFYGLWKIWQKENLEGEAQKIEAHNNKQEARKIEALEETPNMLNYLNPELVAWSNNDWIGHRLRASGIRVLEETGGNKKKAENEFIQKLSEDPGKVLPGAAETPMDLERPPILEKNEHGSWDGDNLIVALGSDPSSSLKAIFTHKPEKLIILVDKKNPTVCTLAARIQEQLPNVPAKEITFWPTDMIGKIEYEDRFREVLQKGSWSLNITPGTKAQSWQLSRIPVDGLGLWSLWERQQKSVPLAGHSQDRRIQYGFAPILVQAAIVGGRLSAEGIPKSELLQKKSLLSNMSKVIAKIVANTSKGWTDSSQWPIDKDNPWRAGVRICHNERNYIKCLKVDSRGEKIEFEASCDGKIETGWIKSRPGEGHWFEEVAAGAFLDAGGAEIQDIRVGLRWDWLHKEPNKRAFRNDLDVSVLWKGQYIGVSCKTGKVNLDEEGPAIVAVTRTGLGRFGISVIIRKGIKPRDSYRYAQETSRIEPMELGMSLLGDRGAINRLMVMLLSMRRKTE